MKRALLILVVVMAGCSTVEDKIVRGVNGYCATVSQGERELLRARVNAKIAPHAVQVTCEGDQ